MKIETITNPEGVEFIIIYQDEFTFTSMPKSVYDEQQANQASGTIS